MNCSSSAFIRMRIAIYSNRSDSGNYIQYEDEQCIDNII